MAKLSTIVAGAVDPRIEGYPLFNMYGGDFNSQGATSLNLDSQFQVVSAPWGAVATTTVTQQYGMMGDPMFAYSNPGADAGVTNSVMTTQTLSHYGSFTQSLHQNDQYPQALFGSVSATGAQRFNQFISGAGTKGVLGGKLVNHVMPEGMRPRRNFSMHHNTFYESPGLTRLDTIIDSFALNTKSISRTKTVGIGSVGYNENTKTLVTIHSANSTACTATKFVSTVNLNTCASLAEFFAAATVTEFEITMQTADGQNYSDKVVVVGDNGWVGISYRNSNSLYASTYDLSGGNGAVVHFTSVNGTTSYGVSQGAAYYTKMNLTWDGKWAAAYTPYYYYGCGMLCHIFSTEDPRRCVHALQTSASGGGAMLPIGKSGFVWLNGSNTDSAAVTHCSWDFGLTNRTSHTSSTVYTHSSLGITSTLPGIANNANLSASQNFKTGITGIHYSTSYPRFMTVNYWPTNGRITYEGGTL